MADNNYQQQYLQEIVGGFMPELNKQKKGMYDYLLQNSLRTGQSATAVAEGLRPYAEASGQAAAEAGVQASQMAKQQEQFDTQQANWQASFDQGQRNWEQEMAARDERQDTANMMAMFQSTGWTPELLEAMGYSDSEAGSSQFNRLLEQLGFNQPEGQEKGSGGYWDQGGGGGKLGAWNNWGGKTGLIHG